MSLIRCPECNHEISDLAISCPHCGFPLEMLRKHEQVIEKEDPNKVVLVTLRGGKSYASSIVAYILTDLLLGGMLTGAILTFNIVVIIFISIFVLVFEIVINIALPTDIVRISRANKRAGQTVSYDQATGLLCFQDYKSNPMTIPLEKVIQFNGPESFTITYYDENSKKKKVVAGFTKKADVLQAREILKNLRERTNKKELN